jgi:hypothetical protein
MVSGGMMDDMLIMHTAFTYNVSLSEKKIYSPRSQFGGWKLSGWVRSGSFWYRSRSGRTSISRAGEVVL